MEKYRITKKQYEILNYLYRFRFLNRQQLTLLMNQKYPGRLNAWLHDLTKKKILGRQYSRTLTKGNMPATYFLASKSKQFLVDYSGTEQSFLTRIYNEKYRSQRFIEHSLRLADMYLGLKKDSEKENVKLNFYTKVDLEEYRYLIHPLPDAYIALSQGRRIKRYFVELIDPGNPRFAIRSKIKRYIEYFQSKEFDEATNHPFPSVLITCPDEVTRKFLIRYITDERDNEYLEGLSFHVNSPISPSWEKV